MRLLTILGFFRKHPLTKEEVLKAMKRFIKWQLHTKLFPFPVIFPFVGNTRLIIQKGLKAATGNLYCGLMEFEEMSFVLHFLNENDLFIDIGANVGTYTVLASGYCRAQTIAIEPIPVTFRHLTDNIAINHISSLVSAFNIGLGSNRSKLKFTSMWDTYNNVITDDNLVKEKYFIEVEVRTLDDLLQDKQPLLLKIDVEGFEYDIIKGATQTLAKSSLKAIIIELNGSGKRYGHTDQEIHEAIAAQGFSKYTYSPFERKLDSVGEKAVSNVIYIRDMNFVTDRLNQAPVVTIVNKTF